MPILDLRIRKVVRRNGARLAVATDRPSALDGGAEETARYAPGFAGGFLAALAAELGRRGLRARAGRARRRRRADRRGAEARLDGDRVGRRADPRARRLRPRPRLEEDGAELLEVPDGANGARPARGRAASRSPGPGSPRRRRGSTRPASATASTDGSLEAALPGQRRPGPRLRRRAGVERGARQGEVRARGVDVRGRLHAARRRRLPGRVLRREGGHGHPPRRPPPAPAPRDPAPGQRAADVAGAGRALRPARRGDRDRLRARGARGDRLRGPLLRRASPTRRSAARGVRWQEREAASDVPASVRVARRSAARRPSRVVPTQVSAQSAEAGRGRGRRGGVRLGTYRDLWAAEVDRPQPRAAVPRPEADPRAGARGRRPPRRRAGRRGRRALQRDEPAGAGLDPRADQTRARDS